MSMGIFDFIIFTRSQLQGTQGTFLSIHSKPYRNDLKMSNLPGKGVSFGPGLLHLNSEPVAGFDHRLETDCN